METLTPSDALAILITTLLIVGGVILWSLRSYILPIATGVYRIGRQGFDHFVEVRHARSAPARARTGAGIGADDAWLADALARDADGACVRAEEPPSGAALVLARDEIGAVARMIAHNKTLAKPNKLATIQAGWPTIKNRSGDPKSQYARASVIYDAIFSAAAETLYPTLTEQRKKVSAS
jgi:hypothetical protein